jgi:hypothetical protein
MIRFVDLTMFYWTETDPEHMDASHKCCAFLDTVTDKFITFDGQSVVHADDVLDVEDPVAARCIRLIPDDFWTSKPT